MMNFFGGFNSHKLKANLKMACQRVRLVNNKMDNMVKRRKKEISKLLESGKEEKARILVEHVIREDYTMEAHELIELLCETCVARLGLICAEKECPFDLVQTVSTLIWVTRRVEIPELVVVRKQFLKKYGKEFVHRAERNENAVVNARIVDKLAVKAPNAFLVLNYLNAIAKQYGVKFTPKDPVPADMTSAMKPPTGYSVKPSPGAGFGNLYTSAADGAKPNYSNDAVSSSSTAASKMPESTSSTAPTAPSTTGGMLPPQFDALDKNDDGMLSRSEFNGDLKIPGVGAGTGSLPIAPVVAQDDDETDLLPLPPASSAAAREKEDEMPKSGASNSSAPTAPSSSGGDDEMSFESLQARFNALNEDDDE